MAHRDFKQHNTQGTHERSVQKVKLRKDAKTAEVRRRRDIVAFSTDDADMDDRVEVNDADLLLLIARMFETTEHAALLEIWSRLFQIVQTELYVDARHFHTVLFPRLVQLNVFPRLIERYFHVSHALSLVISVTRLCRVSVDGAAMIEHLCRIPQFLPRLGELVRFAVMQQHNTLLTQLLWLAAHLYSDHEPTPNPFKAEILAVLPIVELLQMLMTTPLRIDAPLHCTKVYVEIETWTIATWAFCVWTPELVAQRVPYLPAMAEYFMRTARDLIRTSLVFSSEQEFMADAIHGLVRMLREDVLVEVILPIAPDLLQLLAANMSKLTYPLILFFSTLLRSETCPQATPTVLNLHAPLTIDGVSHLATFLQVWREVALTSRSTKVLCEGVKSVANIVLNDHASAMCVFCDEALMAEMQLMLTICPFEVIQEVVLFYCDLSTVIARSVLIQESNLPYDLFRALASCDFRSVDLHVKIALFQTILLYVTEFMSLAHTFVECAQFEQCVDDCVLSHDNTLATLAARMHQWLEFAASDN